MKLLPIEAENQKVLHKNSTASYGLTLVAGLPFPAEIIACIQTIQQKLEDLLPGCITWYGPAQLHTTLFAPLRGRYRDWPPFQRDELPANLEDFVNTLNRFFSRRPAFLLDLAGVRITPEGHVIITENTLARQLAATLQKYPALDSPKHIRGRQVVIGYFKTIPSFITEKQVDQLEKYLLEMGDVSIGQINIQQVHLIHYANRTLSQIVGKVTFYLGQPNKIAVDQLLEGLQIVDHFTPI